jgi:hypothetical protein
LHSACLSATVDDRCSLSRAGKDSAAAAFSLLVDAASAWLLFSVVPHLAPLLAPAHMSSTCSLLASQIGKLQIRKLQLALSSVAVLHRVLTLLSYCAISRPSVEGIDFGDSVESRARPPHEPPEEHVLSLSHSGRDSGGSFVSCMCSRKSSEVCSPFLSLVVLRFLLLA